jgi:hypothetical protein
VVSDTARWFASDDDGWPLSFANICLGLGLDAPTLRGGLERELTDLGARALLRPGRAEVVPLRASLVGTGALRERAARSRGCRPSQATAAAGRSPVASRDVGADNPAASSPSNAAKASRKFPVDKPRR